MCARVLLPVHAQKGPLLAFNQLFGPLVVLWWLCAAIGCSCGCAVVYVLWIGGVPTVLLGAVACAYAAGGAAYLQSTLWTSSGVVVAVRSYRVLLWCAAACLGLVVCLQCCWVVGTVRKVAVAGACAAGCTAGLQSTLWTSSNVVVAVRSYRVLLWCSAGGCRSILLLSGKQWLPPGYSKGDRHVLVMCFY
jgi:hypothetical protein